MLMTFKELCDAMFNAIQDMEPEQIKAEADKSGSELNLLRRYTRRYFAAENCRYCEDAGIIGVGKISFAESRLVRFQQRINAN